MDLEHQDEETIIEELDQHSKPPADVVRIYG